MGRRLACALAVCSAAAAPAAAQVEQLTDDLVDQLPLEGDPFFEGSMYVRCADRVCLVPGDHPLGPPGTTAFAARHGRALGLAPAAAFPGTHDTGMLTVLLVGTTAYPIEQHQTTATYDGLTGTCVRGEAWLPAPLSLVGTFRDPFGMRGLDPPFGGGIAHGVAQASGCRSGPPAGACGTSTQLLLFEGPITRRVTSACGVTLWGAIVDGDRVAWAGALGGPSSTDPSQCGVFLDAQRLEPVHESAALPCAWTLLGHRDGTVLAWGALAEGRFGPLVSRAGGPFAPLAFAADDRWADTEWRPSVVPVTLLDGGMVFAQVGAADPPGATRALLFDRSGTRHLLPGAPQALDPRDLRPSSHRAGRLAYLLATSGPSGPGQALHLFDEATGDTVIPTPELESIASPVVSDDGRVAFSARRAGADTTDVFVWDLARDPPLAPVWVNEFDETQPLFDGDVLYWTGTPSNPGGAPPDNEIFRWSEGPRGICFEDGRGHALRRVRVELEVTPGGARTLEHADEDGCLPLSPADYASVRVVLRDRPRESGQELVRVFHETAGDPETDAVWYSAPPRALVVPALATESNAPLDRLESLAMMYAYTERSAAWAQRRLFAPAIVERIAAGGGTPPSLGPVGVVGYDPSGQPSRHAASIIYASLEDSDPLQSGRPDNVEAHEYGHHIVQESALGGPGVVPGGFGGCAQPHYGLLNGDSGNTFAEGMADLLSTLARAEGHFDPNPGRYDIRAGAYAMLDDAISVWRACGMYEELAFAAALWQLIASGHLDLEDYWVAINTAECGNLTCALQALAPDGLDGTSYVVAHLRRLGLCDDANGDASCGLDEVAGVPRHGRPFIVRRDWAGDGAIGCWTPPADAANRCAVDGQYVWRDHRGSGWLGTAVDADYACSRQTLRAYHFRDVPPAGFGSPLTAMCGGAAPGAAGLLDEDRLLILPNPATAREDIPADWGGGTELDARDAVTDARLPEVVLTTTTTCAGAAARWDRTAADVLRALPARLAIELPRDPSCAMELVVTAPGHGASSPLLVSAADLEEGLAPEAHVFRLAPEGAAVALSVDVGASPAAGTAPLRVELTADVRGGLAPYEVQWLFGDGASGEGARAEHVYGAAFGSIEVVAVVHDALGAVVLGRTEVDLGGGSGLDAGIDGGSADAGPDAMGEGGCGCRAVERRPRGGALLALGGGIAAWRRRRARPRAASLKGSPLE